MNLAKHKFTLCFKMHCLLMYGFIYIKYPLALRKLITAVQEVPLNTSVSKMCPHLVPHLFCWSIRKFQIFQYVCVNVSNIKFWYWPQNIWFTLKTLVDFKFTFPLHYSCCRNGWKIWWISQNGWLTLQTWIYFTVTFLTDCCVGRVAEIGRLSATAGRTELRARIRETFY